MEKPILSITIPTWNRSSYLYETLKQIANELNYIDKNSVEILISDNGSTDNTQMVVSGFIDSGLDFIYVKNQENIGSDSNIAQCFNLAKGKYVLILGDDDLFVDGGLCELLKILAKRDYGVICLKSYGFNNDFRSEYPGGKGDPIEFDNLDNFLKKIGPLITLISACVINKSYLANQDASLYCGTNLVQVHLVLRSAIAAKFNVFLDRYLIACKRNNSGGYNFAKVFVDNLFEILESYKGEKITSVGIRAIESKLMIGFYPFYLYKALLSSGRGAFDIDSKIYDHRFKERWEYNLVLKPILTWPRPLAIFWGGLMTLIGRVWQGDFRRGFKFTINKVKQYFHISKE